MLTLTGKANVMTTKATAVPRVVYLERDEGGPVVVTVTADMVVVHRHPGDWRKDAVAIEKLRDFHLRAVSGGVCVPTGRDFLYARVQCTDVPNVSHSGQHGPCPHEILICIQQNDNDRQTYRRLAAAPCERQAAMEAHAHGLQGRAK